MVDVSDKPVSAREAVAGGLVLMAQSTKRRILSGTMKKGDVLSVAELAGVLGAKHTSFLIPLCHPLPLSHVSVKCEFLESDEDANARLSITATAKTTGQTGVEMEALTACTTAALTVYDMCKAIDRQITITEIRLLQKSGGKSGDYQAAP